MSVKAEALFKRHSEALNKILTATTFGGKPPDQMDIVYLAIIYAACIVAEAVRNELEEPGDFKTPNG